MAAHLILAIKDDRKGNRKRKEKGRLAPALSACTSAIKPG
jgi:hypothetical protein